MNEILFTIGDLPVRTGAAMIGFGALALTLLTIIAIVIAQIDAVSTDEEIGISLVCLEQQLALCRLDRC